VLSGGRQLTNPSDPEVRVSFSTVYAFSQIELTLHRIYGHETEVNFRNVHEVRDWRDISERNFVLLGGVESIPAIKRMLEALPHGAKQEVQPGDRREIIIPDNYSDAKMTLASRIEKNSVISDHAIVMRVIDKSARSSIFSFSGGWGAGTVSGVLAVTSGHLFNADGFDPDASVNQTVVSVSGSKFGPVYRGHGDVNCRPWRAYKLEQQKLSAVVQALYGVPDINAVDPI
jgi:hypothetical protein